MEKASGDRMAGAVETPAHIVKRTKIDPRIFTEQRYPR
jgi:hypothetical protein